MFCTDEKDCAWSSNEKVDPPSQSELQLSLRTRQVKIDSPQSITVPEINWPLLALKLPALYSSTNQIGHYNAKPISYLSVTVRWRGSFAHKIFFSKQWNPPDATVSMGDWNIARQMDHCHSKDKWFF